MLALYRNVRFGGNVDPERAALLAMYHDATEIITIRTVIETTYCLRSWVLLLSEISVVRIILALSTFLPTIPSSLIRQSSVGRQALSVIPTTESRLHLRPDKEEFI